MPHHVLLIGGHGKIAQLLTPLLLQRSWTVTSMIRAQDQVPAIEKLSAGKPGKLNVLVSSIEDITAQEHAASILEKVKPNYIAFSAGAGGKGGADKTFKVDRDAAVHFVKAAAANQSIARFLLISYNGCRRAAAPWWDQAEWDDYNKSINYGVLATYFQAKIVADEVLRETVRGSKSLTAISLRPGTLTDEPAGGVELGKTSGVKGTVSRETVAKVASALLSAPGIKSGWVDLLGGNDEIDQAVQKVVDDGVDTAEGEAAFNGRLL
ncbi:hypothetical protein Q7P37_011297 [Cladosporium fusiforme]